MEKDIRISLLFDFYGPVLSDKIRKAVDLYHNDDLSLSEISLEMGITRRQRFGKKRRTEAFGI